MRHLLFLIAWFTATALSAGNVLNVNSQKGTFPLCADGRLSPVSVSPREPLTVRKVAALYADDVQRVTGQRPAVCSGQKPKNRSVVIATIGHNAYVDGLIARGNGCSRAH